MLPRLNLLVIEDNEYDAEILEDCLQQMDGSNCSLKFADSVIKSEPFFDSAAPDLVILDLDLPDSKGLETLNRVSRFDSTVPIVVMTDNKDPQIGLNAIKQGAQDFIRKSELSFPLLKKSISHAIERKRMLVELERMQRHSFELAMLDSLTGLPNRMSMMNSLQAFIAHAKRSREKFALLFVDLDEFKPINDVLGHQIGDLVLKTIADRLRNSLRESDIVARIGGDEFICILHDIQDLDGLSTKARKLNNLVREPIEINGQYHNVGCSIGIAIYPDDGRTVDNLLSVADKAMYAAKRGGRNQFQYAAISRKVSQSSSATAEQKIRTAIEKREICLYYQPIINILDNTVLGCEALVRWNHPQRGLLLPRDFLPEAENTSLIIDIDECVLREAGVFCNLLSNCGLPDTNMHINVSAKHFTHPQCIEYLSRVLSQVSVDAKKLNFEIPESLLANKASRMRSFLEQLTRMGVTISIKDFGMGTSSMQNLYDFPIAFLKIDRSFVQHIGSSRRELSIVKALISMAKNLNIDVIANGVESQEQAGILGKLGCAHLQGYYYSRPLPPDELKRFLLEFAEDHSTASVNTPGPGENLSGARTEATASNICSDSAERTNVVSMHPQRDA